MVKIAAKHPAVAGFRVYCEIYRAGERVSFGHNRYTQFRDPRYMKNEDATFMHAEIAALVAAESKPYALKGAVAFVARARKTRRGGEIVAGIAKPCPGCERALRDYGIVAVYYTNNQARPEDPVTFGLNVYE